MGRAGRQGSDDFIPRNNHFKRSPLDRHEECSGDNCNRSVMRRRMRIERGERGDRTGVMFCVRVVRARTRTVRRSTTPRTCGAVVRMRMTQQVRSRQRTQTKKYRKQ